MVFCDNNPSILQWGSEEIIIPYRAPDGKLRRYFPDFYIKVREKRKIADASVVPPAKKIVLQAAPKAKAEAKEGSKIGFVRTPGLLRPGEFQIASKDRGKRKDEERSRTGTPYECCA